MTIACLSACLSLGPLVPTGEEKEWRLHLSAPALTCTESRMWTIQAFSSQSAEMLRCRGLKKLGALCSGGFLLCLHCFLGRRHSQYGATDPEPQMAALAQASRTTAKEAASAGPCSQGQSELTLTWRSPPPQLSQMHRGEEPSLHL